MEDLEFKLLIEKYQQGLLSGKEEAMLDEWFSSLAGDKNPVNWSKADNLKLKRKILEHFAGDKEAIARDTSQKTYFSESRSWHYALRAAASILLLAACTYVVWQFTSLGKSKAIATLDRSASKNINKLVLGDGSIVWLKGSSTLTYPQQFTSGERHVTLKGEALFEVAKDSLRPFIIQCGELITTVLGTSFNIKASENNIEVVVLTGKVSLTSESDREGVIVLPNEKALYWMDKKQIAKVTADLEEEETRATVVGTEYRMQFEDTKMGEVIRRIEGKFDVQIQASDPNIGNCMITADFTGQSLARTLDMIAQALGFDYEIRESTVTLTGEGCLY